MQKRLKIAVIAGEESGDLLAADLVSTLRKRLKAEIELIGVGGTNLTALGLNSFFDREDIAIMGVADVIKRVPRLLSHINRLTQYFIDNKPDFLLIVDSPDFTHRVAKKLRKQAPFIPIIQYVAPTVWAWRSERANKIRSFVDLLLVVLPFEPQLLAKLHGPKAVYVGHRLLSYPPAERAYAMQKERQSKNFSALNNVERALANKSLDDNKTLLVLPGSRHSEISKLMPVFGETIERIKAENPTVEVILPTLPHLVGRVKELSKDWRHQPYIVSREYEKWAAFAKADAALAASGTVSLELALCSIPTVLSYKTDWIVTKFILPRITIWSAALPNIITDEPIIPEYFNEYVRPPMLARQILRLLEPGPTRQAQLQGFERLRKIMQTRASSGELAVQALVDAGYC